MKSLGKRTWVHLNTRAQVEVRVEVEDRHRESMRVERGEQLELEVLKGSWRQIGLERVIAAVRYWTLAKKADPDSSSRKSDPAYWQR